MATFGRAGRALRARSRTAAGRLAHTDDAVLTRLRKAGQDAGTPHYQTIQALSGRLNVSINSPYAEGQESALADAVVTNDTGVVLICWEHQHIPAIATALPTVSGTQIPPGWPGDRFDLIWSFSLKAEASTAVYRFSQMPQQVLAADVATIVEEPESVT